MLQAMGSQRVGHNLETEQLQILSDINSIFYWLFFFFFFGDRVSYCLLLKTI